MKENLRKYGAFFLALIIIAGVYMLFAGRKSGMFIDEIYTYGLSNSHYAPFLTDTMEDGSLVDKTLTRQDLLDYVNVNTGEGFDFGSVYYNQEQDVHPPLYYWLFNIVSSFTPNVFSKWTGLILDFVIFMLSLLVLYKVVLKLFKSHDNAAAAVILYGLSNLGLSCALMIRMYVLLTLLTLTFILLIICLMEKPRAYLYPLIFLNLFAGLMTQYYFVFYAFFLCLAYFIYALSKKQYKNAVLFAVSALLGVAALVAAFPACLTQLFADKLVSGGNAVQNLTDFGQYKDRLLIFYHEVQHGLKAAVCITIVLFLGLILSRKKIKAAMEEKKLSFDSLVIIVPAFITLILVAIISPVPEQRYVYNIGPVFIIAVSFLIYIIEESWGRINREFWVKKGILLLTLLFALEFARYVPPRYMYPEYNDYNEIMSQHSDEPCVFMTDNYFSTITEALAQLLYFDNFYVANDPASEGLDDYIASFGDKDECVVYIDVNSFWSSGYAPEEMLPQLIDSTDYNSYELLFKNGLTETYLLQK